MSKDDAIKFAIETILRWTNDNAALAHEVANELASLDWQQVITDQKQRGIDSYISAMRSFLKDREDGYGFCDTCKTYKWEGGYKHGDYTKVYYWPHTFPGYNYQSTDEISSKQYCWNCFYKMQASAEQRLTHIYREKNPQTATQGRFGPVLPTLTLRNRMDTCHKCKRLFPIRAGYEIKQNNYCLHCIEGNIEQQFVFCKICNKKTANVTNNLCSGCYSSPKMLIAQIASHLSRARAANTPATLTIKQWSQTVEYFGERCAYCQSSFQLLEHFLPISLGGGTTFDNCVPGCHRCNVMKSNLHPDKFGTLFPQGVIDRIKNYLQGETRIRKISTYAYHGRELIVYTA